MSRTDRPTHRATSRPSSVAARSRHPGLLAAVALAATVFLGCRQDMHDQPRYEPFEVSEFFADGMASRLPVEGTVARGHLRADTLFYTGKNEAGVFAVALPVEPTAELLRRGRERYDIFCSPCHGRTGDGKGMVVRRGFKEPPSFHLDRLREQPVGYYFDAVTAGFGTMPSYASQVEPRDRWAIAGYIKVLQYSQRIPLDDLPASDREAVAQLGRDDEVGGEAVPGAH